jgi:hypothetical protein
MGSLKSVTGDKYAYSSLINVDGKLIKAMIKVFFIFFS